MAGNVHETVGRRSLEWVSGRVNGGQHGTLETGILRLYLNSFRGGSYVYVPLICYQLCLCRT